MEKFPWKSVKLIFLNIFSLFIQLYIAKVSIGPGSGEHFPDPAPYPDPTKKDSDPDPQPWIEKVRPFPIYHHRSLDHFNAEQDPIFNATLSLWNLSCPLVFQKWTSCN